MFQPLQKGGNAPFPFGQQETKALQSRVEPLCVWSEESCPGDSQIADVTDVHDWTGQDAKKQLKELQELGQAITRLCLMSVAWKQFQGMCWPTRTVVT